MSTKSKKIDEVLAEHGDGTARHRFGGEGVTVDLVARHAAEQRAREDPTAVELDGPDVETTEVTAYLVELDVVQHAGHLHRSLGPGAAILTDLPW